MSAGRVLPQPRLRGAARQDPSQRRACHGNGARSNLSAAASPVLLVLVLLLPLPARSLSRCPAATPAPQRPRAEPRRPERNRHTGSSGAMQRSPGLGQPPCGALTRRGACCPSASSAGPAAAGYCRSWPRRPGRSGAGCASQQRLGSARPGPARAVWRLRRGGRAPSTQVPRPPRPVRPAPARFCPAGGAGSGPAGGVPRCCTRCPPVSRIPPAASPRCRPQHSSFSQPSSAPPILAPSASCTHGLCAYGRLGFTGAKGPWRVLRVPCLLQPAHVHVWMCWLCCLCLPLHHPCTHITGPGFPELPLASLLLGDHHPHPAKTYFRV